MPRRPFAFAQTLNAFLTGCAVAVVVSLPARAEDLRSSADLKTSAARDTRCFSGAELGQLFAKLEPAPKVERSSALASTYETEGPVVELEPFIVTSERDTISERIRREIERPILGWSGRVERINGVPKTLENTRMISLISEPAPGRASDAPSMIPLGLIFATPTIARDFAGWWETHFVK